MNAVPETSQVPKYKQNNTLICFFSGKPSADPLHPDYTPRLFPDTSEDATRRAFNDLVRYENTKKRNVQKGTKCDLISHKNLNSTTVGLEQSNSKQPESPVHTDVLDIKQEVLEGPDKETLPDQANQTIGNQAENISAPNSLQENLDIEQSKVKIEPDENSLDSYFKSCPKCQFVLNKVDFPLHEKICGQTLCTSDSAVVSRTDVSIGKGQLECDSKKKSGKVTGLKESFEKMFPDQVNRVNHTTLTSKRFYWMLKFACTVRHCNNRPDIDRHDGVERRYYNYPVENASRLKQWLTAAGRNDLRPREHNTVCSDHFVGGNFIWVKVFAYTVV